MRRRSPWPLLLAGLLLLLLSSEGCSRKNREAFGTGVRLGKSSKLCETEKTDCTSCCQNFDATFTGSMASGKCNCTSTTETYDKAAAAAAAPSASSSSSKGITIAGGPESGLTMDLPTGYRPVKGLSIETSNWVQARSEDGFGDRYVSVNSIRKDGRDPFDKYVAARILVLRNNVSDSSTAPAVTSTLPQGTKMTYDLKIEKNNARMLVMFLETTKHFHEIKAWSTSGSFSSARTELDAMAALVHEK